jgi:hypothetical protein
MNRVTAEHENIVITSGNFRVCPKEISGRPISFLPVKHMKEEVLGRTYHILSFETTRTS